MKKIKIFTALDHLDTYELNRFDKYVNSPYFNKNESLSQIVSLYVSRRKKELTDDLEKEELWQVGFPAKPFNDGRLRKALSDLLKLYEDFLCQELLEKKPIQKATLLMEAVEQRKLEALYNSSMKRANRLTLDDQDASAQMHYHRFQTEKYYYQLTDFDLKRTEKSNLANIVNSLDHFYLAEKLKYYCTSISQKAFISHEYNFLFIEEIKDHIADHKYANSPIVSIWISIFYLQINTDIAADSAFQTFKETFDKIISNIPQKEAAQIFTYGQNYCIKRINSGSAVYFQELFELNQKALDNKILFEGDNLDPWVFRNIVTVALRLKEFEWTSNFISSHASFIQEQFRGNAVEYSKALLFFYLKDYEKVLDSLNSIDMKDISYELNTKSLLILTYYEKDEFDILQSLLDSFYVYLNRHKDLSQERRDIYLNQISFTKKLLALPRSDKAGHQKLLDKLNNTKIIGSRAWLKEKILERLR